MECVYKRQKNDRETHKEWERVFEVQIPFSAPLGLQQHNNPIVIWKGKICKNNQKKTPAVLF